MEVKDSFINRRGDMVILKRSLGGETTIHRITGASLGRLKSKVGKLYQKAEQKPYTRLEKSEMSDEFFEQWKADNENNLIDLGKSR